MLDGEVIRWSGKPNFLLYVMSTLPIVIFALFWVGFTSIFGFIANQKPEEGFSVSVNDVEYKVLDGKYYIADEEVSKERFEDSYSQNGKFLNYFMIPFYGVGALLLLSPVGALLRYSKEMYAFTNSRVLMSTGFIGMDYKFINFDQIKNSSVNVGLFDKLFGTGSINIFSGEFGGSSKNGYASTGDRLIGIKKPYDVYKDLQSLIKK
ncbi:MAG: hypothetical protein Fur003_1340 [Candidatus Dojkabacteria bacterium]